MNQGKLDIIKQEMARLNFSVWGINDILGISELKWMGLGKFNSDDHDKTVGKNPLEEMELPLWSKRVWNAILECNLKSDRMISVHFRGKPFNITVIQVYTQTTDVEEAEVDQFCEDLQHLLELTPKERCTFHHRGLECESRKSRDTSGNRKVCPWSTKWGRAKANRPLSREYALDRVIENTLFQQPKRWLCTWTSPDAQYQNQIDYIFSAEDGEALYSQQK